MPGESKQTTNSTSQATPYAPAQGSLDALLAKLNGQVGNADLTSTENSAFDTLTNNAKAGNPFTGQITDLANNLLSGGGAKSNDANILANLGNYQGLLGKYANGSQIGNNTALKDQLQTITDDVTNQVNGQFAAAGRDMSGMNTQTLGRGIAQGTAPVIAQQFNTDTDRALGAASSLYGAGNTTYGMLNNSNQQDLSNKTTGIDVGSTALQARDSGANQLLAIEAQKRGIPMQALSGLLGTISPVAQAFGTTNSSQTTTSQQPLLNTLIGGLTGGLGLLGATGGFGSGGWLLGSGKGATGLLNRAA
jgi:hypothetical protein